MDISIFLFKKKIKSGRFKKRVPHVRERVCVKLNNVLMCKNHIVSKEIPTHELLSNENK